MTWRGCVRHFLLTFELSFKSPQGIVYAYLVPVIFLLAFASVFRADDPPLGARMGQLITITILGGACFGLPTLLVAERERGIWKRYRLLPVATPWLLLSTLLARTAIVISSVLFQLVLARAIFGTPLPAHPLAFGLGFLFVIAAFLGMGFLIAALADNVPAVQALGQCIFLPMILIGGVGVPLAALPPWAQRAAGFMPGRYAVETLQPAFEPGPPWEGAGFRFAALASIGLAAGIAGAKLFRWESGRRSVRTRAWVGGALAAWVAVGAVAWATGRLQPVVEVGGWRGITEAQMAEIRFDGLPPDTDIVASMGPAALESPSCLEAKLAAWAPGRLDDAGQSIRNLVAAAAIADLSADPAERAIARLVFRRIRAAFEPPAARQALAWVILDPDNGTVIRKAPELGLPRHPPERLVRQRSVIYAKKFLGRLLGRLPD